LIEPTFDSDGYPTDETLDAIRDFQFTGGTGWGKLIELFDFCVQCWAWRDCIKIKEVVKRGRKVRIYRFATGGWSGNESIIACLNQNLLSRAFWCFSSRGGLHVYEVPMEEAKK
jgi:hypothetical protein